MRLQNAPLVSYVNRSSSNSSSARRFTMLEFAPSRKSCVQAAWRPPPDPRSKLAAVESRRHPQREARKSFRESRPHSYHGNATVLSAPQLGDVANRKLQKFKIEDDSKSVAKHLTEKLLASLNCAQANIYPSALRRQNTGPSIDFGAGGGFADISRTWRFHPFRTRYFENFRLNNLQPYQVKRRIKLNLTEEYFVE